MSSPSDGYVHTAPTLADVAAAAGVSAMTASRALNGQPGVSERTRQAIMKVATTMGYVTNRVAQKLSSGQSGVIGVIANQFDHPFVCGVLNSMVLAAADAGNEVLAYSHAARSKHSSGSVLSLLKQFTDGVVILMPHEINVVESIARGRFPTVMVDSPHNQSGYPSVEADSYGGAREAMRHLAGLGHKRIAFVAGTPALASATTRLNAYEEAVAVHGLERDAALIAQGNYNLKGGRDAATWLLALERRPTAIFAANDLSAFGVMATLHEHGLRIPEDISLVGFDDIPAASHMHPMLTTVAQPMEAMGRSAVSNLLSQIAGVSLGDSRVTLPTQLVIRRSTGAPPTTVSARPAVA